jgi:hypothetical protein
VNQESILSLLVKIYYKNKTNQSENHKQSIEFSFLNSNLLPSKEDEEFQKSRIGDESDFIYNLLEQASKLNEKCRFDIQKTLNILNEPSENKSTFEQKQQYEATKSDSKYANETKPSCSSSIEDNALTEEELLKNAKKSKAKQRQQKLLAQMSSNQKAFLSNPINKIEIEAFDESTTPKKNESTINASSLNAKNFDDSESSASYSYADEKMNHNECEVDNFQKNEISAHSNEEEKEEIYDCCICRLSTKATPDRPIGVVTLLQVIQDF